jgi:segregation and condensation protein B
MEQQELKGILEALLFASATPLTVEQMKGAIGQQTSTAQIQGALEKLVADYQSPNRGVTIEEVAGGFRFYTRPECAPWIRRLVRTRQERRFSIPALETLAIVAYRQPITRAEIEMVRGVNSDGVLETLLERGLVKVKGHREGLGRPRVYGTTQQFLEYFKLRALEDLPDWKPNMSIQEDELSTNEPEQKENEQKTTEEESLQQVSQSD